MVVAAVGAVGGGSSSRAAATSGAIAPVAAVDGDAVGNGAPQSGAPSQGAGTTTGQRAQPGGTAGSAASAQLVHDQDSAAALETSAYLQKLYLARAVGLRVEPGQRPAEIAPERVSGLVDYLQDQVDLQNAMRSPSVVDVDA